ncbi:MAG TPA: hypothetical protein VKA64_04580 [Gammaproteobacteria bacterium]|nr:hypothetical protein [Gammaproteobacteria bacterium]
MKYSIRLDGKGRPLPRALPYGDETERMAAEHQPPAPDAVLRAGTREPLMERFGLRDEDFIEP